MSKQSITLRLGRRRNALVAPAAVSALARLGTPLATTVSGPAGEDTLRFGLMGMDGHVGEGPALNGTNPYRVVQWNPFNEGSDANITNVINTAKALKIWLIAMAANNSASYGGGLGGGNNRSFNQTKYRNNLLRMKNIPAFTQNVWTPSNPNGFIFIYMGDEPYLNTSWEWNTSLDRTGYSPAQFNQSALDCKSATYGWPGCITAGRLAAKWVKNGWQTWTGTYGSADWTGLDYCWMQYEAAQLKVEKRTFMNQLANDRSLVGSFMGVACGMNLMNVGPRSGTWDGLPACWDYNNDGVSNGIVCGPWNGWGGTGFSEGQKIPCAQVGSTPVNGNFLTSPQYVALTMQHAAADPDIPWFVCWTEPVNGPGEAQLLVTGGYWGRPDYVSNFRQAQINGENRTHFNGFRTPK